MNLLVQERFPILFVPQTFVDTFAKIERILSITLDVVDRCLLLLTSVHWFYVSCYIVHSPLNVFVRIFEYLSSESTHA